MGFRRFKSRDTLIAVIKSIVYALALGITVGAVFFVLTKRLIVPISSLWSIAIGGGCAVLAFVCLFFILRSGNKQVARRLDDEFCLGERVTTMLELESVGGPMAELQREDTETRLAAIPTSSYKTRRVWAMIVAAVVSVAMLATGFIVPAVAAPEEEEVIIDEFEKDWRIASLRDLIARVKADNYAETGAKDELIAVLEGLIEVVKSTDKDSTMRLAAIRAVGTVDTTRSKYVSAHAFATVLKQTENQNLLELARPLEKYDDIDFTETLEDIVSGFSAPYDESIVAFVDVFNTVITGAGISAETDALAALFTGFSMKLRQIADNSASISEVKDAAEDLGYAIFDVLLQQQDNDKIILIVRSGIISIFELTADDFAGTNIAPPTEGEVENEDKDQEDDITPGAGYGKGDKLAGSNDSLYDHDQREQVTLPTVVDKYYNRFDEIMDDLDGDLKSAVEEYFELLKKPESLL